MSDLPRPLWIIEAPLHNGVTFAARNLAAGMVRNGCAPAVFALQDGESAADFEAVGAPVRVYPRLGSWLLGSEALGAARGTGATVVHALVPSVAGRAARVSAALGVPLFVTANRLDEAELRGLAGFTGQGIIAVSRALRERIANLAGLPQDKIHVIHDGLDLSRIPRPQFDVASNTPWRTPVIGSMGLLTEKKGQRVFLQAVSLLLQQGLDAEFVILGDGPDRVELRHMADEMGISKRVTFTPQTISGQLAQLNILVEPSFQEGLGITVLQAMANGVPVVASGVGGLYDLIEDGLNGQLVPVGDPEALAKAIMWYLDHPAERMEMARQARQTIEKEFGADLAARRLIEYYTNPA